MRERFLTQKMSWNRTNRFPHHSFLWEGIDGSRVFTHFPPVDTYSGMIEPFELAKAERQFAERGVATRSMLLFGHGDGGGGPARDMLERFRRLRNIEGLPTITMESPAEFFDAAIEEYPDPPVWVGELYFEMHRGTYTSQARTKQGNRRCEVLLREAELWSVAAFGGRAEDGYPAEALDRIWKEVLTLQFHDILPGSSIGWVHREAEETHARLIAELEELIDAALDALRPLEALSTDASGVQSIANAAPFHPRRGRGRRHCPSAVRHERCGTGGAPAAQRWAGGGVGDRPPRGNRPCRRGARRHAGGRRHGCRRRHGPRQRVGPGDRRTGRHGFVVPLPRVGSGGDRLRLAEGLLQLHPDLPVEYDAWDIDEYYRRNVTDLDAVDRFEVTDRGPLVARVRVERSFRSSTVSQTYELRAGSPRLDVHLDVDWQERNHLLKLAWPVDVHANDVTRHIQYGHLKTPIHTNTTWDAARFELCAHHWIDVGEPGFGVALLNDGRYGHDVTRTRGPDGEPTTTMRLTCSRAPSGRTRAPTSGATRSRVRCSPTPAGSERRAWSQRDIG